MDAVPDDTRPPPGLVLPDLRGQVALVTGASLGIGAAVAQAFGAQGMRVAVHYHRSRAPAEAVAEAIRAAGGQALLVAGDVTDPAAVARCVAEVIAGFGGIDVLVNNAGGLVARAPLAEQTDALFDDILHLNARSAMGFMRGAVADMRRRAAGGAIINVTSAAARQGGGPGASLYAGSKGFVSAVTRSLARELVGDGIRVNGVAPGFIQTPLQDRHSTPQMLEQFRSVIPMGRLGTPQDCVGAFLYLASRSLSGYVTGQVIEVNGGYAMP